MTELKNSIERFNSKTDHAEKRINKLEDKSLEFSQLEEHTHTHTHTHTHKE